MTSKLFRVTKAVLILWKPLGPIAIVEAVFAVPAHEQQNDLDAKAAAPEQGQQTGSLMGHLFLLAKVNASEPVNPICRPLTAKQPRRPSKAKSPSNLI
jgi:hypothetical protein